MNGREYIEPLVALLRPDLAQPRAFEPGKTRIPATAPSFGTVEIANAVEAAIEFKPAAGRWAVALEKALARFFFGESASRAPTARLTNSGSSANLLAVAALMQPELGSRRLKPGDEVITVAAGFATTIAPIVQLGLVPVFVDVREADYNVDAAQLEAARSDRTRAVFLAHTLGFPFNVAAVTAFCRQRDNPFWLIEDNCDAVGATWRPWSHTGHAPFQKTGTFGDLATLSFYPAHHMTTGEGGAVLTDDPVLSNIVTSLRDWGRDCYCAPGKDNTCGRRFEQQFGSLPLGYDHKYVYSRLGYNLRMTDMQAAIGCAQIEKINDFIRARQDNWKFYREKLDDLNDRLAFPFTSAHARPSPFGFLVTVKGAPRDSIVRALEERKIGTRPLFAGNLLRHPAMRGVQFRVSSNLTATDRAMRSAFWIGVGPWLTKAMRDYVVEVFHEVLKESP